ncbi:hypothetical protein [Actinokineospora sp. NPDC004072]
MSDPVDIVSALHAGASNGIADENVYKHARSARCRTNPANSREGLPMADAMAAQSAEPTEPDRNDGTLVVTQIAGWIVNADTKSGFLATGVIAVGAADFVQLRTHFRELPPRDLFHWLSFSSIAVSTLLLLGAATYLVLALTPKLELPVRFSRYAFPSLVGAGDGFVPELDMEKQREESWFQARALALIAKAKFAYFTRGLRLFVFATLTLGVAYLAAPAGLGEPVPN